MNRRKALQQAGLLTGGILATPSLFSLLQSCQLEKGVSWKPLFFNKEEALLISSLVDVLLPRTETPGALDVNVDRFMDLVFAKTLSVPEQEQLRKEMAVFNASCVADFGAPFIDLSIEDQQSILTTAEAHAPKFNGSVWGTAVGKQKDVGFYRRTKAMAIWAYFSSEKIGKEVLAYDPIPGGYNGCLPLSEIGKRWTF
jgi:hypothetical protein